MTVRSAGGSATRYPAGAQVTLERVIGHRDTGKTACPGDALYAQLDDIRALVETGAAFPTFSARVTAVLADYNADYREVVPVNGALAGPDGSPLAGQAVEVQVNSDNAWRTARRVTTGADGAFATDLTPGKRMYVRVRYPGTADVRGAASQRLLLRLHPLVALTRRPRGRGRGQRLYREGHGGAAQADRERGVPAAGARPLANRRPASGQDDTGPLRHDVRARRSARATATTPRRSPTSTPTAAPSRIVQLRVR